MKKKLLYFLGLLSILHPVFGVKASKEMPDIGTKNISKCKNNLEDDIKNEILLKYNKANKLFEKKKYQKALKLYDEILNFLINNKKIIEIKFKQAICNFYNKDYSISRFQLEDFYNEYPSSQYTEEALYMMGVSIFKKIKDIYLLNENTEEALSIFELYLEKYPQGKFKKEAEQFKTKLIDDIIQNNIYIAKTYYKLNYLKAAKLYLKKALEEHEIYFDFQNIKIKLLLINILYKQIKSKRFPCRENLIEIIDLTSEMILQGEDLSLKDKKKIVTYLNKSQDKLRKLN